MKTLYHPNVRDLAIEVAEDDVDRYVAQGWRKTEPKRFKDAPATPAPAPAVATNTDSSTTTGEDN